MYCDQDVKFSKEGDIEVEDGDFKIVSPKQTIEQQIRNRLNTNNPEWLYYDGIGADQEDFRGENNTKKVAQQSSDRIRKALTYDGLISNGDLSVESVPTNAREITHFITVNIGNETLNFTYKLDLG
jgi:hypothetical protein